MIPDIELQLQTIVKSLRDNVLPAVDPENELAQQQMQISLATLGIVLEHLPLVHNVRRRDISIHSELAEQLLEACSLQISKAALNKAVLDAKAGLADATLGFAQLQQVARSLRDVIGQVVSDHAESESAPDIERLVLETSTETLQLGRAWNKPMSFEPDPAAIPGLAQQLML